MPIFQTPFGTFLLLSGTIIITLIGLSQLRDLVAPLFLALMLAVITMPTVESLQKRGLPRPLALIAVTLAIFLGAAVLVLFLYVEMQQLSERVPQYQVLLGERFAAISNALQQRGIDPHALFKTVFAPASLGRMVLNIVAAVLGQSASLLLFLLLLLTLTLDYQGFAQGFSGHLNPESPVIQGTIKLIREIQVHFRLMTLGNLISAIALTLVFYLFKIDFPILWGTITFFLSYIPRIGMLMSFIPTTILAFILYGPTSALLLLLMGFAFNGLTDNFITPRLTGKGLGLRGTTVIFSAMIWIWVLGPLGALLGIPMTLLMRTLLASHPATAPLAYAISTEEYAPEGEAPRVE